VLVVDDDADIREMVALLLESELQVVALRAGDGCEALRLIDGAPGQLPIFIVSDVRMPRVDGVELTRRLKAGPATHSIPVVVMTASVSARDDAVRAGADDYLDKPFDVDGLLAKVRPHLRSQVTNRQSKLVAPKAA
jgi:CheY-like chemotaxis protein